MTLWFDFRGVTTVIAVGVWLEAIGPLNAVTTAVQGAGIRGPG